MVWFTNSSTVLGAEENRSFPFSRNVEGNKRSSHISTAADPSDSIGVVAPDGKKQRRSDDNDNNNGDDDDDAIRNCSNSVEKIIDDFDATRERLPVASHDQKRSDRDQDEGDGNESGNGDGNRNNANSDNEDPDPQSDSTKSWQAFVDAVAATTADDDPMTVRVPNLDAYSKAKVIRNESSVRLTTAIRARVRELRDTIHGGILSELIAPLCNKHTDRLDDIEERIVRGMVSNSSRRNKLMNALHRADAAWKNKYDRAITELTSGRSATTGESAANDAIAEREKNNTPGFPSESNREKTVADGNLEDPDWEALREHEPSRERIDDFLEERWKQNRITRVFETFLEDLYAELEHNMDSILDTASNLHDHNERICLEKEIALENLIMGNHRRRCHLRHELEESAQRAQGLYADLLSSLKPLRNDNSPS